jgi:hypothetical protein
MIDYMTDFKASIKIEFSFMGKTERYDGWINYWDRGDGLDDRVAEWFREKYEAGMIRYRGNVAAFHKEENERTERRELERLRAKYDT